MKKSIIGIVFIIVAFAMAYRLLGIFRGSSVETRLEKVAAMLNKKCPMVEDKLIRVETVVSEGRTLVRHCTALEIPKEKGNAQWLEETKKMVTSRIRASDDMQLLLKAGVSLKYTYEAESGGNVGEFKITPADIGVTAKK